MTTDGRWRGWDRISDRTVDESAQFGTDAFYAAIGRAFVAMCAVVPFLVLIELADKATGGELDRLGAIWPRHLSGIDGILFAPLLHAGFAHLIGNSVALIILGTFALATGTRRFIIATVVIAIVSGVGVWLLGPSDTLVVGASGIIFGYVGYLLVRGILERSLWSIGAALLVALLFGSSVIAGVMPGDGRISWQGHLFGFIGGVLAGFLVRRRVVRPTDVAGGPDAPATTRQDLEPITEAEPDED